MNYQTILFDFDGVLCKDRFYEKTLLPKYRKVYDWIQSTVFGNKELVWKWMRGQIDSIGINRLIAESTGIGFEKLIELYEESVRKMELEKETIALVKLLKQSGKKVGIVTDNMDVFTNITIPSHQLNVLFDVTINSADYGLLKKDDNGKLFDIALASLDEKIENSLMIDDSDSTIKLYGQKGGQGFRYHGIAELKSFLQHQAL
jgi:FMN phosphatase YigB (HAD superfamily)